MAAAPLELAIGNVVRRVLTIIREESADGGPPGASPAPATTVSPRAGDVAATSPAPPVLSSRPSLQNLLLPSPAESPNLVTLEADLPAGPVPNLDGSARSEDGAASVGTQGSVSTPPNRTVKDRGDGLIKSQVMEAINSELIDELEIIHSHISEQAIEHIHANEVIMTFGRSRTVDAFLLAAARKRKFEVIVCESAPSYTGQTTAQVLSDAGLTTTVITDAAIFAMMARANKVVIGAHAVMANGGIITNTGGHMLAMAAKFHSVPFIVATGLYKLSPLYPIDQDTVNDSLSPTAVLTYEDANTMQSVDVKNPAFDYIPPELVGLFVTNYGGHAASYVYRLLAEYYSPEDYVL